MKRVFGVLHRLAATAGIAVVAFAFSVGVAASASAATYYFSPDGDDTNNDGTEARPWKSWNKAWGRVADGGEAVFMPGKYYVSSTGFTIAAGKTAVVRSYSGNRDVIIDGDGGHGTLRIATGSAGSSVTMTGFVFTNMVSTATSGLPGAVRAVSDGGSQGEVVISNCTFTCNKCGVADNLDNKPSGGAVRMTGSNTTVIDCDFIDNDGGTAQGGAIYVNNGTGNRIVNCRFVGNRTENYGGAVLVKKNASNTVIADCVFRENHSPSRGGALFMASGTVSNCVFEANRVDGGGNGAFGAALYHNTGTTLVQDCVFTNNWTSYRAPAIYAIEGELTLRDSLCISNRSENSAGAIFIDTNGSASLAVAISNLTAIGNHAKNYGGVLSMSNNTAANLSIRDSRFIENKADAFGGALALAGSGHIVVADTVIQGNQSVFGGGVLVTGSDVEITGCAVLDNQVIGDETDGNETRNGGGIANSNVAGLNDPCTAITGVKVRNTVIAGNRAYCGGGFYNGQFNTYEIENCVITNNTACRRGGGVYVRDTVSDESGYDRGLDTPTWIRGCLIAGNTVTGIIGTYPAEGAGVYVAGARGEGAYQRLIENCTITDNAAMIAWGVGGINLPPNYRCDVRNTICAFNTLGGNLSSKTKTDGGAGDMLATTLYNCCAWPADESFLPENGCVAADPKFNDAANGDYTLRTSSPCRDAGAMAAWMTGALDLAGNRRIKLTGVDIGAYEIQELPGMMVIIR